MTRVLLTWSDRGVERSPSHHAARPSRDLGPVLRLLQQSSSLATSYEKAIVLTSTEGKAPAKKLIDEMKQTIPTVELIPFPIKDPSNYEALFRALEPIVERFGQESVDILLSAGTPQMQTLWVILVKAGLLKARMLQVIPPSFVPSVHPSPIREVILDFEGFPEIRALREEVVRLRAQTGRFGRALVHESKAMQVLLERLTRAAPSDIPILIEGETGTGKELVARAIHNTSKRAAGPLIAENCGALTESVLASELFGHKAGSFTGATYDKRGLFELAHGGTLFLDEVGELSPRVQVNLLRVLQDGRIRRLGSETDTRVDVRIITATHRNLSAMVKEGSFREDLYYRLRCATLAVPPLRDRQEDLEGLVQRFLDEAESDLRISRNAWRAIRSYSWPGNVRELRAEVMRWHVFCDDRVTPRDLAPEISETKPRSIPTPEEPQPLESVVSSAERNAIEIALRFEEGNLSRSAKRLAIDRNTLKRKITKLGIDHRSQGRGRPVSIN